MKVLELLRAHVVKVQPTATVREMVDLFDLYQVLLLPVIDENDVLLGVVYEEQVVDPLVELALSGGGSVLDLAARTAVEIMIAPPPFIDEHDGVKLALDRMVETGHSRLVVTNNSVVTGAVSRVDICQGLLLDEK
jgi:CBS domain-containing protein